VSMAGRVFPDISNKEGKTHPERGQQHAIGRGVWIK
jgi:hypothetical protein